ncbi:acetyltransferase [Candidatus Magnetomoraceae bacterium gMMP-15]
MSIYNLDKIFKPASVAVVGASEKEGSVGCSLLNSITNGGYEGKVFPVNPKYKTILGLTAYPSLSDIEDKIDLAIISTPITTVSSVMQECVQAEVGGTIIISAGGKEMGKKGRQIESEIEKEAAEGGVRIIGPNCIGIISHESKLNASFVGKMPLAGKVAFISQSGALCTAIIDLSLQEGIGFRYFVSIGSMLDVDFGDLINYAGSDPWVSSIVLYIESLKDIRKFMSAARAVSRIKPIIVLKAGRSGAGAKAASSHTGALAGEDSVYDAAFKRAGIVRVDTVEELFDCAELIAKQPLPPGPRLGIITNGGGTGVMAADALAIHGLDPVSLSDETMKELDSFLPSCWSRGNPIDILGDASPERWQKSVETCLAAKEIDALVIIFLPQALTNALTVAQSILDSLKDKPNVPVFAVWMGGESIEAAENALNKAGIATYETPERAIDAFVYMHCYARNLEILQEIPPKLPATLHFDKDKAEDIIYGSLKESIGLLTELEAKELFKAYGIPVSQTEFADSKEKAISLAQEIGFPVVMKIHSRDIVHKSDSGGVQLSLRHEQDVMEAYDRIMVNAENYDPNAEVMGVTIQPMLKRPDYELIMGSKQDPDFGPVILFGMGGIMTEVLKDMAIALPPLNRLLARRLMQSTKVYKILKGYRNIPEANMELLEEILIRLAQLVTDFPEIEELDINPMIMLKGSACAVDARVILKATSVISAKHLAISPYPNHLEITTTTEEGRKLFIRPIKPEDAPLFMDLFNILSLQSVYYRFFSVIKTIPHEMLARFTQIDYDRDMALVGLETSKDEEKMLGVARLMADPDKIHGEFSVLIGDPWQGKGIGAALMEYLIEIAKKRGMESLWGVVLAENKGMLALGRKLGFDMKYIVESRDYELKIDLKA